MIDPPRGWAWTTLGDIAETQLGKMLSAKARTGTGGRPYLRNKNVQWGRIELDDLLHMDFTDAEFEKFRLRAGDLLVCEGGEVGRAAIWREAIGDYAYQKALHRLRPRGGVLPEYLFYLLMHYAHTRAFERYVTGSTIAHLPQEGLRRLPVPLSPIAEQRRIVGAIEEHLSRIAAAQADLDRARGLSSLLRARLLDSVNTRDAKRVPVGSLVPAGRKIAYGVLQPGPHVAGGTPLVRVGNVDGTRLVGDLKRIDPAIASRYPRTALCGGEVLLTVVGTIGRTAVVPTELAGANVARAVSVIPLAHEVDSRYVAVALSCPTSVRRLTAAAHEVARKTLNLEDVRKFEIPVPPLTEQRAIVGQIDAALAHLDALDRALERASGRGDALRCSILTRAFYGELVPQDPNDEPASVLLQRIVAESGAARVAARRPLSRRLASGVSGMRDV